MKQENFPIKIWNVPGGLGLGSIRERKLLKELTGFLQTLIHKRAVESFVGSKKIYFLGKLGLL